MNLEEKLEMAGVWYTMAGHFGLGTWATTYGWEKLHTQMKDPDWDPGKWGDFLEDLLKEAEEAHFRMLQKWMSEHSPMAG